MSKVELWQLRQRQGLDLKTKIRLTEIAIDNFTILRKKDGSKWFVKNPSDRFKSKKKENEGEWITKEKVYW